MMHLSQTRQHSHPLVVKANIAIHLRVLTNIAIVLIAAAFSAEYCSMRVRE